MLGMITTNRDTEIFCDGKVQLLGRFTVIDMFLAVLTVSNCRVMCRFKIIPGLVALELKPAVSKKVKHFGTRVQLIHRHQLFCLDIGIGKVRV